MPTQQKPARFLSDAYLRTKVVAKKPAKSALIVNGVKYVAGKKPVRVCPASAGGRSALATPLRK